MRNPFGITVIIPNYIHIVCIADYVTYLERERRKKILNNKLPFERDYFIASKISNYEDYRKRKFEVLALDLINSLGMRTNDRILDFGCATGGLLSEFRKIGYWKLKGTDISYWAIDYGKKTYGLGDILEYFNVNLLTLNHDYLFLLDVLEHIPSIEEINNYLKIINANNIVVRIPICRNEGEPFFYEVSRNDTTHVQCHTKKWWIDLFEQHNFELINTFHTLTIHDSEGVFAGVFKK